MEKIKQTTVRKHIASLKFKYYLVEPKLCVLTHLNIYLKKTKSLRGSSKLFVSYIKPHKAVSKDTLARWCKSLLAESGIDTNKYSTHSCRSAASSKAKRCGAPLATILDSAGLASERTFAAFYDKKLRRTYSYKTVYMATSNS